VLDAHGEVVALTGELDQSGMALRRIDQEIMTRGLVAAGFGRRLSLRDIDRTGHVCKGTRKVRVRPYPTRIRASTTMASSSNHCQPRGRRPITIANRTIAAGAVTGYIPRMRFEKVWVQQCRATKAIKRRFGAKSALDYLVGEKLISFADAARAHPAFARELPKFLAAI
jgi:hypothetical protein